MTISVIRVTKMFYHTLSLIVLWLFCYQDHKDVLPQVSLIVLWLFLFSGSQRCFTTIVTDCTVTISVFRITKMFYHNCHWLYCDYFCYQDHKDVLPQLSLIVLWLFLLSGSQMFYHKCHWLHYDYFCYQDHRCFTTSVTNCTVTISVIRITDVLSHFVTNCTVTISAIRITKMCYQKCHWLYCDYFCYQGFRMFLLPFFTLPYSCYNYFQQ
jgi:hypothetical protein